MNKLFATWFLALLLLSSNSQASTLGTATNLLAEGKKLEALSVALAVVDAEQEPASLAAALLLTAQIYIQLGEPIFAEDLLNLALADRPGDQALELKVRNELGAISTQRGDYEAAIENYSASLNLARVLGQAVHTRQRLLVNLANAMLDAGETDGLQRILTDIGANLAAAKLHDTESLIATAVVYRRADLQTDQPGSLRINSLNLLSSAFAVARNLEDDRSASLAIGLQGELYMDEGRWEEALKLSEIALLYAQQAAALEA